MSSSSSLSSVDSDDEVELRVDDIMVGNWMEFKRQSTSNFSTLRMDLPTMQLTLSMLSPAALSSHSELFVDGIIELM